ncbi:hypothetical protein M5689_001310 [Euphorbia peplus]|nr:hypothetical protein M5689_001310 [Euphorbia peplus]
MVMVRFLQEDNDIGDWIIGFLNNMGRGNSFDVECWGIDSGINLAMDLKIKLLEVESDNLELIRGINNGFDLVGSTRNLMQAI